MSTIRMRIRKEADNINVSARIRHKMETGRRLSPETDEIIPAFYVTEINCYLNKELVMTAYTGTGISTNPYFSFDLTEAKTGDELKLSWIDNHGNSESAKTNIQ